MLSVLLLLLQLLFAALVSLLMPLCIRCFCTSRTRLHHRHHRRRRRRHPTVSHTRSLFGCSWNEKMAVVVVVMVVFGFFFISAMSQSCVQHGTSHSALYWFNATRSVRLSSMLLSWMKTFCAVDVSLAMHDVQRPTGGIIFFFFCTPVSGEKFRNKTSIRLGFACALTHLYAYTCIAPCIRVYKCIYCAYTVECYCSIQTLHTFMDGMFDAVLTPSRALLRLCPDCWCTRARAPSPVCFRSDVITAARSKTA